MSTPADGGSGGQIIAAAPEIIQKAGLDLDHVVRLVTLAEEEHEDVAAAYAHVGGHGDDFAKIFEQTYLPVVAYATTFWQVLGGLLRGEEESTVAAGQTYAKGSEAANQHAQGGRKA